MHKKQSYELIKIHFSQSVCTVYWNSNSKYRTYFNYRSLNWKIIYLSNSASIYPSINCEASILYNIFYSNVQFKGPFLTIIAVFFILNTPKNHHFPVL